MFDTAKSGSIETSKIRGILNTLDIRFKEDQITKNIEEVDRDSMYYNQHNFQLCEHFVYIF